MLTDDNGEKRYDVDAVKSRLVEYREKEDDIAKQYARLDRMEMKLKSFGSSGFSDMPKSKSQVYDKEAHMVAAKLALESEIQQERYEQEAEKKELEGILSHLKRSKEKAVIRARYFDVEEWSGVNELLFGDKEDFLDKEDSYLRRTHMIHGSALLNMAKYIEDGYIA